MFKHLLRRLRRIYGTRFHVVFNDDSPGVKTLVRRNFIQRWLYPRDFTGFAEVHLFHFIAYRRKVGTSWSTRAMPRPPIYRSLRKRHSPAC